MSAGQPTAGIRGAPQRPDPAVAELTAAWDSRRRDPAAALRVAESVRDAATARGDAPLRGRALTVEGACLALRNDFASALHALLEAVALLDDVGGLDRARALAEAGQVESVLGDVAAGRERLYEALRAFEALGDDVGVAMTLNRLGVSFFTSGDLVEAQHAYERSLALHHDLDDPVTTAGVRNNLAKVATARGELEVAFDQLMLARAAFESAAEWRGVAMTEHNLALVHEAGGEVDAAERRLRTAVEHYERSGHLHGAIEARIDLGRLLGAGPAGRLEARDLLARAHEEAERLGFLGECATAAEGLADVHEAMGDSREALYWLRHLRQVERGLFDAASDQRLQALQMRFKLEQLERDSITDALTGVLNRRGLDLALAEAVTRQRQGGEPAALLLLDLDDFKLVNDRHSHAVGDEVLRRVAKRLKETVRPTDACARFGGEEFAVVLPGCDLEQAEQVAEQVRRRLAEPTQWEDLGPDVRVTTSIGVAPVGAATTVDGLLAAADRALYAAKRAGKDRVRSQR